MELKDKVIVVTGGAHGIGRALVERFAAEGARGITIADIDRDAAEEVAARVDGMAMRCDVASDANVVELVRATEARFGPIDLLCSNAGIGMGDGDRTTAAALDDAGWQRMWSVNVLAHVRAARAVLPSMLARGEGYLLQTASAAGLLSQIGDAAYSTTKHAAIGFAESLAITHGDQGIRVSVLCPQGVVTAMTRGMENSPQAGDGMLQPEEVAESVVEGLADERFLILPHPQVLTYMQRKSTDYDRWLRGMRRFRKTFG